MRLTPKQLFQHQTIAELAEVAGSELVAAEQGTLTGDVPLTPIISWFTQRNMTEPHHFNQSMLLETDGWSTILAEGGVEGLDKARQAMPDLIVCDLTMPGMDGIMTLEKIRNDPRLETIPVLMVSGRCDACAEDLIARGAQGLLQKPFRLAELLEHANLASQRLDEDKPIHAG